jgi:hypothetical protein
MREVERTDDEITTYLNDYLGIHTEEIRKAMKISMKKINHVLHIKNRQEATAI